MPKDDETPAAPAPAAPRPGRGLRIALAVSLALNLAVAGLVAGLVLRGPPIPMMVRDLGFGPFAAALTETDRRALRAAFHARRPDLRAARQGMRTDLAAVSAALRADPFRPGDLRAAMDRSAARTADLLALGQTLLVDHVLTLSDEARRAMADRLDEAIRHQDRGRPDGAGRGD